jgi:hypothetical protein
LGKAERREPPDPWEQALQAPQASKDPRAALGKAERREPPDPWEQVLQVPRAALGEPDQPVCSPTPTPAR